jgi:predicted AlkP superfamily phosphohydrolase/phosphomutase
MRYLRMLSNSAFAGFLAAVYLTLLLLLLNPEVALTSVGPILTVILLSYGIHITVLSYALYAIRQIAVHEPFPPGWISLRLLTWSAAALSGAASVITWLHVAGLRDALDPRALPSLRQAAAVFGAGAFIFLLLGFAQTAARQRRRAVVAILFTITTISIIVVPVFVRGPGLDPLTRVRAPSIVASLPAEHPRVILLCLDGASLDVISPAVAAGRLPNFGRMLDAGASMHLATTRPTQPEPVWASIMTGMWPSHHGVRGSSRYRPLFSDAEFEVLPDYLFSQALVRFGLLGEAPYSSASVGAQPLWRIAAGYGVRTGLVGLPLTHPATSVSGFIVSDRFHRQSDRVVTSDGELAVSPSRLDDIARGVLAEERPSRELRVRFDLLPWTGESGSTVDADRLHHRLARQLAAVEEVQLLAVRYAGLDAVGHYYQRYARPEAFGDVTEDERRRFGRVLDDYYAYVDSLVGDAIDTLREGDLLMVVSGFGMEPLTVGKRLLERVAGDPRFSGTHERGPDGFLLAYGTPVVAARQGRGAVVDVAPTLLYFLGLPVARDMDGFARTDLFTRAFNEQRTITFIPTYGVQ